MNTPEEIKFANQLLKKYPDRIPIIITKVSGFTLSKTKFLVPTSFTMADFINMIRQKFKLKAAEGYFIFINDQTPPMNKLITQLYKMHCDSVGYLKMQISKENTFG